MAHGPYSRVYHELADDHPEVYDTPLLADYVRLLVAAEQAYPTRAKWAGHASRAAITRLVDVGLVTVDGARFTVKGLEKERGSRAQFARDAANVRWHGSSNAQSNAQSNAESMLDKTRQDETRQDEQEREHAPPLSDAAARARLDELRTQMEAAGIASSLLRKSSYTDTDVIEHCRDVIADDTQEQWKRDAARAQLEAMRVPIERSET